MEVENPGNMASHSLVLKEICCEERVIHNEVEINENEAFTVKT